MNLEPIDTSTTAGKAEVMRLAAEGRRIAFAREGIVPDYEIEEIDLLDVAWNWEGWQYFIIAEPIGPDEMWALVSEDELLQAALYKPCDVGHWKAVRYIRSDLAGEVGA